MRASEAVFSEGPVTCGEQRLRGRGWESFVLETTGRLMGLSAQGGGGGLGGGGRRHPVGLAGGVYLAFCG